MTKFRRRTLIMILSGIFLALVFLPFTQGRSDGGFLDNLNEMYVPFGHRIEVPAFSNLDPGYMRQGDLTVEISKDSKIPRRETFQFDPATPKEEITRVMRAWYDGYPRYSRLSMMGASKFVGWTSRSALEFPYRWILVASLLLIFLGIVWGLAGNRSPRDGKPPTETVGASRL